MSLHLEMLQAARLAPRTLGESTGLVFRFLRRHQTKDGGFKDRHGRSDLYYTVFGLDGLLSVPFPEENLHERETLFTRAVAFLRSKQEQEKLDFVHLCCLARGLATVRAALPALGKEDAKFQKKDLLHRIEQFRSRDGGYHSVPRSNEGSAYGCFLALGAYQDCQLAVPQPEGLVQCLQALRTPDGAWANAPQLKVGGTNATAAAMAVLRQLKIPVEAETVDWLRAQAHPQGGFRASPSTPMPDLLSTATALHALAGQGMDLEIVREKCVDYLDTLWTNAGAFHGHWADDQVDVEYTFYGLLALGHLSP